MFYTLIGFMVTMMPMIVKMHQTMKLGTVHFNVYKPPLNKKALKILDI
jgi:hypothetical protein